MAQFKKGDKVRVIERAGCLQLGSVYTVASHSAGYVKLLDCPSVDRGGWFERRFELVQDKPREFRCMYPDGTLSGRAHTSVESIEVSARDLGQLGVEYRIVEIVPVKTVQVRRVVEEVKA